MYRDKRIIITWIFDFELIAKEFRDQQNFDQEIQENQESIFKNYEQNKFAAQIRLNLHGKIERCDFFLPRRINFSDGWKKKGMIRPSFRREILAREERF